MHFCGQGNGVHTKTKNKFEPIFLVFVCQELLFPATTSMKNWVTLPSFELWKEV